MKRQVNYFSKAEAPQLEIQGPDGTATMVPFIPAGPGRAPDERRWLAEFDLVGEDDWQFRVKLGKDHYDAPAGGDAYQTRLRCLWLQDGQIFSYQPAPAVSPSRVIKIPDFKGSLPSRALYLYLPRGYDEHTERAYPVLYMHDGQNCFETFAADSFAGSWRAEQTADWLIGQGQMQECLIVGVSNGGRVRPVEYLPPYVSFWSLPPRLLGSSKEYAHYLPEQPVRGWADRTLAYYRYEVADYIGQHYRVLAGREHTATCGSSMGGLFSAYIAWERSDFARSHAMMSPSFWLTQTASGKLEAIERLRTGRRRDVRLWLDSGTQTGPGEGNDGMFDTIAARDALLANGYIEGPDFQYYLDEGGLHNEASWAARLHRVFRFLFPIE
jgi:predicted alpha/beta superfamily hydrolase